MSLFNKILHIVKDGEVNRSGIIIDEITFFEHIHGNHGGYEEIMSYSATGELMALSLRCLALGIKENERESVCRHHSQNTAPELRDSIIYQNKTYCNEKFANKIKKQAEQRAEFYKIRRRGNIHLVIDNT